MKDILDQAAGEVKYPLKQDLMFHLVMQQSKEALKGLLAALLSVSPEDIKDTRILNPISNGKYSEDKEIILDIKLILNNNHIINIEIQIYTYTFWINRSLFYTARMIADQDVGKRYQNLQEVTHIVILDYTLFPKDRRFYSEYRLLETHSQKAYTDKFTFRVLDMSSMDLAAPDESALVYWTKLFRASTWEEIRELARKNPYIRKAANAMYEISAEQELRNMIERREKFLMDQASLEEERRLMRLDIEKQREELNSTKTELDSTKTKLDSVKTELGSTKAELDSTKTELDSTKTELDSAKTELDSAKTELDSAKAELTSLTDRYEALLEENRILKESINEN